MKGLTSLAGVVLSAACALQACADQIPLAVSQSTSDVILSPDTRSKIQDILRNAGVVGYSVGVFRAEADEKEEYAQWGLRTEQGAPVTKETIQFIGSLSKAFAATALGLVIDDFANGRNTTALPSGLTEFTWDTKILELLPNDWKLMDEWASTKISVRDALSHVSGLASHDLSYRRNDTSLDIIRRMRYLRPSWELRQRFEYNNQQYIVAQHLVERYSGISLDEFAAKRIFAPLNMSSSTYSVSWAQSTGQLSETRESSGRRIPTWFIDADTPILGGPGGVLSSAPDLLKWTKALIGVTNSTASGIPQAVLEETMSAQSLIDKTSRSTYGFGWGQVTVSGFEIITHSGGLPGASTFIAMVPALKAAVVLLASSSDVHNANSQIFIEILRLIGRGADHLAGDMQYETSQDPPTSRNSRTDPTSESPYAFSNPVDQYAGVYHDAAYGDLLVCPVSPNRQGAECQEITHAFAAIGINPGPVLLGKFRRQSPWADYLSFTPTDSNGLTFSVRASTIFPKGYGIDTSPFSVVAGDDAGGSWQLASDGSVAGLGFFDAPGARSQRHILGKTIQEKAQVWFEARCRT